MLEEGALQLIQTTAVRADQKDIVHGVGPEPGHIYFQRDRTTGNLERKVADRHPRRDEFYSLDDLAAASNALAGGKPPKLYCGCGHIISVLDDGGDRRERLTMQLPNSVEFTTLTECENRMPKKQKSFIELLRINLHGCIDPAFVTTFRDIKFSKSDEGEGQIQSGRETIGRKVRMEVATGGKPPPEEMDVTVFVYRDLVDDELKQTVKCAVDTNVDDGTFTLIPLAGELEKARRETDAWIKARLIELIPAANVYCGQPS